MDGTLIGQRRSSSPTHFSHCQAISPSEGHLDPKGMPMSSFSRTFALAVAGTLGLTGQALAHAELKSATPPVNGTVTTSPSELDLEFSEGVDPAFTGIELKGPDDKAITTGKPALAAGDDTRLVVPLSGALAAGTYSVSWHALSTDGHKTKGRYTFTVGP
jgi:methionine-rich copper-binding protein CopC